MQIPCPWNMPPGIWSIAAYGPTWLTYLFYMGTVSVLVSAFIILLLLLCRLQCLTVAFHSSLVSSYLGCLTIASPFWCWFQGTGSGLLGHGILGLYPGLLDGTAKTWLSVLHSGAFFCNNGTLLPLCPNLYTHFVNFIFFLQRF